jgi:TolB protein
MPDPSDTTQPVTHEFPIDLALGKPDYLEVVGFAEHKATAAVWYRLLNCGFRIPTGAGTDAMANYASLRGPVGLNRVYVRSGRLEYRQWLAALRAGRTFATNGPLLGFTLEGKEIGDSIRLPAGQHTLTARVTLRSIVPIDHLEIVGSSGVVATVPLTGDRTQISSPVRISTDRSGWYTVRAWSEKAEEPILDMYPFATTSPIYVTVGGRPVRSPADAEYFLQWIASARRAAERSESWNTPAERDSVLQLLDRARDVYRQRAAGETASR